MMSILAIATPNYVVLVRKAEIEGLIHQRHMEVEASQTVADRTNVISTLCGSLLVMLRSLGGIAYYDPVSAR